MKLYMHPVSTVCRPIRLLCAENGIKIDEETIDLMTGAHHKEAYASSFHTAWATCRLARCSERRHQGEPWFPYNHHCDRLS